MLFALFRRSAGGMSGGARVRRPARIAIAATLILGFAAIPTVVAAGMQKLRISSLDVDEIVGAAGRQRSSLGWSGGSNTGFTGYASPGDVVRKLPESLVTLFFRPFPWEARNGAAAIAAVDTLLFEGLWIWLLASFLRRRRRSETRFSPSRPAVRFLLVWTALWTVMFMNMTANLGTMVRHRVQIVPVVLLLAAVVSSRSAERRESDGAA